MAVDTNAGNCMAGGNKYSFPVILKQELEPRESHYIITTDFKRYFIQLVIYMHANQITTAINTTE